MDVQLVVNQRGREKGSYSRCHDAEFTLGLVSPYSSNSCVFFENQYLYTYLEILKGGNHFHFRSIQM